MHFQVFVPNETAAAESSKHPLEAAGLADFVDGANALVIDAGPDTRRGHLFAWWKDGVRAHGFQADAQTWIPAFRNKDNQGAGRYWVGLWNASPPVPDDMQRPYACPGERHAFADGRKWLIPKGTALPTDMRRNDDGTWRFEVQRRYHEFYLESLAWFAHFGKGATSFLYADAAEFLERTLRVNYRILPEVINALGLFTSDNLLAPLLAACCAANTGEFVE